MNNESALLTIPHITARLVHLLFQLLAFIAITFLFYGCNSDNVVPTSVSATIEWPLPVADSRYMPVYANSVKIQLYKQKKVDASLANETINRLAAAPWTTTIKLKDALPPGNYQLIATGYLQPNAAGDIVSTATVNFTLTQSEQEVINISQQMNTAIDHITIADTPITLQKNSSQDLNYTVYNSDNVALMLH